MAMFMDKLEFHGWGCAKMLTAFFTISLSCRNISFSRLSFLISSSIAIWCPFPGKAASPCSPNSLHHLRERTIRNTKISGYLRFTLSTGFKQMNSLLLEFLGVGRLRSAHKTLLFLFYHISLLRPPNFGGIPFDHGCNLRGRATFHL